MSFKIDGKFYTYGTFIDTLIEVELDENRQLKVSCFLTEFTNWNEGNPSLEDILLKYECTLQDIGEIKRAIFPFDDKKTLQKFNVIFYLYLDPVKKILFSYTDEKTDIIRSIFGKIVKNENNIYSMFISSSYFNYLIRNIKNIDDTAECTYFTAKHLPTFITKGKNRPNKERTIIYHAIDGDGVEALRELKILYGILPNIMRFRFTDIGTFEIHSIGLFRIASEYVHGVARLKLLEIMELLIEYILIQKKILTDSRYTLIPIEAKYRKLNIPSVKTWSIDFNGDLDDEEMNIILDVLMDNNLSLYNYVKEVGNSFRISGMVADGDKNSLYSIYLNNKGIIISPFDNCTFDTFFRFYETIVGNIAPDATIEERE
jgi:hypothetical protein